MKLSVVIPTCHRPEALLACLLHLQADARSYSSLNYEIIVSDDGRDPLAAAVLGRDFPDVRWIAGPRRGPAANRNAGAAAASGDVVVFLDDDCLPQPGLFGAYATAFTDTALLAAEGRIRGDRPAVRMDEEAPFNEHGGCFWSCNIAVRRTFFLDIRGFDERFPAAAMEDVELRERIRRQGAVIRFVPEALVIHPLRLMGGWSYVRRRAEAHGIYILIPGCHLGPPRYRTALWHTLRVLGKRFIPRFISFRGRGSLRASRMLLLPFWSVWAMKKALRHAKRSEHSQQ